MDHIVQAVICDVYKQIADHSIRSKGKRMNFERAKMQTFIDLILFHFH